MKKLLTVLLVVFTSSAFAQEKVDSTKALAEILVKAFESNRVLSEVAAPVHIIGAKELARFENNGILPALNVYPGIRMEERSPGSYRISIRGSSVRSPFGVRNVKVYWNEIPFTDANGVSYFNLLDANTLGGIEVLKGPSASSYGAGIGGVLLLEGKSAGSKKEEHNSLRLSTAVGEYHTQKNALSFSHASTKMNATLTYAQAETDGYRDHSEMGRASLNLNTSFFLTDKYTLNVAGFYSDLAYETPGGLTLDQKNENPRQARQATKFTKSSEEQEAAIYQKMLFLGISNELSLSPNFRSTISIFGNKSDLENPFITNYEFRDQHSLGARNKNVWQISNGNVKTKAVFGFEVQKTNSDFDVYDNEAGEATINQYKESVAAFQGAVFAQFEAELKHGLFLTAGLSLNKQTYAYERVGGESLTKSNSGVPLMPRISVLKSFDKAFSVFASVGKGFSPPTVQEFVTVFNPLADIPLLDAESGTNYEVGLKGERSGFSYQANVYALQMNDAIIRGNIGEEDVFYNAGKASQKGIELLVNYTKLLSNQSKINFMATADFKDYKYLVFSDQDNVFDGNKIPSVPDKTFNLVLDYTLKSGLFWNNNVNFTDEIPLNDENDVFSEAYCLLNSRLGWQKDLNKLGLKVYVGGNNLLDVEYSLGDDINPFGSRYYNPSPPRNWNGGAAIVFHF